MYEALCSEVTHLHAGLKFQAGLIQKLRPLLNDTKQGNVQIQDSNTLSKFFLAKVTQIFNVYLSVDQPYDPQYANIKYDG